MEEYETTDKTWWWATDFMYKHLLSTGQSWSHVQKLHFVTNLSEMFKRIQIKANLPRPETKLSLDAEKPQMEWNHLVVRYNDGEDHTFSTWVDASKVFAMHINGVNVPLEPSPPFDAEKVRELIDVLGMAAIAFGAGKCDWFCKDEAETALLTALRLKEGE